MWNLALNSLISIYVYYEKEKKRNYHMIVKVSYKFMIFELFKLSLGILLYSSS